MRFEQFCNGWFAFLKNYLFECNSDGVVEQIKAPSVYFYSFIHVATVRCCLVNCTESEHI